ncbi:MAG TPA: M1 family aminopeptidase, partial [Gemmatimonadales bacterium]
KTVRFRAEQVHHFAFSLNPEYVYEQGRFRDVVVHVLYQPSDRATWGAGLAVRRTETALAWLDSLYGPFAWPQITNVHRMEGGGTEFPMMVMNGGASLGLILHEVGHNYTMGILANNEWREGYLDEGFTSFQTAWYEATHGIADDYAELEAGILLDDVDRWSEPVSTVSERFRDFFLYNEMIYNKGELFFDELRYVVGEETMRRILRTYYARWKLKHVDEDKFRAVCEEVSHQDLKWLFAEWLHATPLIDYRLERVERHRGTDGRWHIAVTVRRLGDGVMPLEIGDQRHLYARTVGQADSERVEFTSDSAPGRLVLDPRVQAHDWNMLNNREPKGIFRSRASNALRFDNPTRDVARRDRETSAILPVGWSNDQGGFTFGVRLRDNYLGRFDRGLFVVSQETRRVTSHPDGVYFRFADPVSHVIPRTTTAVAAWSVEGRAGVALSWDRSDRRRWVDRADPHSGFDALWMATTNLGYLDRRLWDDAGTFEAGPWKSSTWPVRRGTMSGRIGFHGGIVYRYPGPGIVAEHRYDVEPFLRGTAELATHLPFWLGTTLGLRGFAGGYAAHSPPPAQRRIYVAGADPYATFTNPLLRSSGALFVRPGFFYQEPGDANLRGFAPELGGRWALSGAIEVSRAVFTLPHGPVRGVALHLFGDGGLVDSAAVPNSGKSMTPLWDAGAGVVATARAGDLGWTMRVDLPLLVSRWAYAADARARERRAQFRWLVSLAPSF